MKKTTKLITGFGLLAVATGIFVAADHIDAPSSMGTTADIADYFAFEPSLDSDNTVFIVDLQSNVVDGLAYGTFDEDVLTEINIDVDGDLIEDMVIQAIPRDGRMYFFGPVAPDQTGLNSQVLVNTPLGDVGISGETAITETTTDGVSLFAGPRQDPFFFDFFRFNEVLAPTTMDNSGFNVPGEDTFDGANTMSIAIELPNSLIGETTATNVIGVQVYKTWVTTNRKQ
ncbi:hypothetical protein MTsPCn9_02700 [Croceitalea sp. MTPC9]|uniref:DUF4331 family protein n=1 Tax=unclassified Croceitalea TaxID=2632280 RepID=UPI002B3DBB3E|nr:hypothetical protein MTsPCn6_06010 [Croceitalea sp. MTPC6]GMN15334.1 hypothetical protein MTsPCn9_02700 [Croceitalea sp. MTPC9]